MAVGAIEQGKGDVVPQAPSYWHALATCVIPYHSLYRPDYS